MDYGLPHRTRTTQYTKEFVRSSRYLVKRICEVLIASDIFLSFQNLMIEIFSALTNVHLATGHWVLT